MILVSVLSLSITILIAETEKFTKMTVTHNIMATSTINCHENFFAELWSLLFIISKASLIPRAITSIKKM